MSRKQWAEELYKRFIVKGDFINAELVAMDYRISEKRKMQLQEALNIKEKD